MQCSLCNAEVAPDAGVCGKCGATLVYVRSTVGVFVGWVAMMMIILWAIVALPLLVFPFIHYSLAGYPWIVFVIGTLLTAGLFWYSKSTVHAEWRR